MYSIIASPVDSMLGVGELLILKGQSLEYSIAVASDLYRKSVLNYRIIDDDSNKTVVFFIQL